MKASICLITYNHEDYIAEAIESVLKQNTSFSFELVIGEDKSTDRTREICEQYAEKHPHIIRLLPPEKNQGMIKNFLRVIKACRGEYVAFVEGDDYWTDTLKLQKQIDFLEANPDFSVCFHNVVIKYSRNNSSGERVFHKNLEKDVFQTEDLLGPWFMPTGSVVFINYPDFILPEWFQYCKSGDIPFLLLISLRGKIKYLDEIMGVYRLHDTGVSVTHVSYDKIIAMMFMYENFNIHTNYKYKEAIKKACIYEIDKHAPAKDMVNGKNGLDRQSILVRGYKKIKRLIGPDNLKK